MDGEKLDLKDMTPREIEEFCLGIGEREYRGRQIFRWLYRGVKEIDQMTDLPESLRVRLKELCRISRCRIEKKYVSSVDGTTKYLLKLEDGNIIESVLMEYSFGVSACISTQVGCAMGCSFCASTIGGLVRSLTAGEMADEILAMAEDTGKRISHIVLMGSGEPLDNFANTVRFLNIANSPNGLNVGQRHITLSTCALVPQIKKLADLRLQITLAVSLHAPNDRIRSMIMPVARRYSIEEIIGACKYYIEKTGRRVTFEYSLIMGINDSREDAMELSRLLRGMLCHVNLIPVNEVAERDYKKTAPRDIRNFKNALGSAGIDVTVRREMGADINAACGQLRKNYVYGKP